MVYGGKEIIMKLTWKMWLLIIVLILSILAIQPNLFKKGVVVDSVEANSELAIQGLKSGEIIKSVNGQIIEKKEDYSKIIGEIAFNGEEKKIDIVTDKNQYILFVNETPKITVSNIPSTKIKTGLDLTGGARALVEAEEKINDAQLQDLVEVSRNRFNVYGLTDVQIKGVSDLEGNKFMLIEVAGATPNDLEELISKQGKFEAKVGNISVFQGGKGDISDVCRNNAQCSGIRSCSQIEGGYGCNFAFVIYLTESAAKRHADVTRDIPIDESGEYLAEDLYLFVDDKEMDVLKIGRDLKGQETTQISIQGSGTGETQQDAFLSAQENMKKLQTILLTGSLPYKLNIVKLDTISPTLGQEFTKTILIAGLAALGAVSLIVFLRYRRIKASFALLFTSFSEILIILGVASLIKWNLDLPSIAGILATIGTGVDSQIVIIDEAESSKHLSIKERLKRALFIIFASYATAVASLLPLYWAGAGLLKGFAITSLIGITAGVLISRPAFADMVKYIEEK